MARHPAILYYDFVLTIPQEVERYWKRRLSWGSALFFLNRYSSVLSHIPIIYEYYWNVSQTVEFHLDMMLDIDLTSRWWCPVEVHREVPCVPKVHTQRVPLFQL